MIVIGGLFLNTEASWGLYGPAVCSFDPLHLATPTAPTYLRASAGFYLNLEMDDMGTAFRWKQASCCVLLCLLFGVFLSLMYGKCVRIFTLWWIQICVAGFENTQSELTSQSWRRRGSSSPPEPSWLPSAGATEAGWKLLEVSICFVHKVHYHYSIFVPGA